LARSLQLVFENSASAILEIPKASYDGVRVLELFEQHRMAGTTKVVQLHELLP
jgi:hypothetical protein